MIPPIKNGCIVLDRIRREGYRVATPDPSVHALCKSVADRAMPNNLMSFLMVMEDTAKGETIEYTRMRPPYDTLWVEVVANAGQDRLGCLVSTYAAAGEEGVGVNLTVFAMTEARKRVPELAASVNMRLTQLGDGVFESACPIYTIVSGEQENRFLQEQTIFPVVKMLRRMNFGNVGFYAHRDPDEDNAKLPRIQRRAAMGRKYHVLTIRDKRDMREGRKIVDHLGIMPLHWARGHIARYGPEFGRGLMFGLYAGEFWIQPHAKGKAENGIVDKGYRLAAPNAPKRLRRRHRHHNTAERETPTVRPVSVMFTKSPLEAKDAAVVFDPSRTDQPVRQEARP